MKEKNAMAHPACATPNARPEKPNLIFVLVDQWRRPALGFRKEDPVQTPNLDRFAEQAAAFNRAVATNPVCGPNRACLFTGQYSLNNGVIANDLRMDEDARSFGVVCREAGYQTGYIGKWHIDGEFGYTPPGKRRQGFDFWHQSVCHAPFEQPYYIQDDSAVVHVEGWAPDYAVRTAQEFIRTNKEDPFALVVSYGPPHNGGGKGMEDSCTPGMLDTDGNQRFGYGYKAPAGFEAPYRSPAFQTLPRRGNVSPVNGWFDSSSAVPGYFGAISALDHSFGQLLRTLEEEDLSENTLVVFISDHGEILGSHGRMTKDVWYEESVGIPCLIGGGGLTPRSIDVPFNSIDLMPTLLELMNLSVPDGVDGTSFAPLLRGEEQETPPVAFISFIKGGAPERYRNWRAGYTGRYTYVLTDDSQQSRDTGVAQLGGEALYDRAEDPLQLKPVLRGQGQDALMDQMHTALAKHLAEINDPFLECAWAGRENKAGSGGQMARYDALIERNYKTSGEVL